MATRSYVSTMLRWSIGGLSCALLYGAAATAAAQAELPVEIGILEMVNMPAQSPRITVTANAPVKKLRIVVREGKKRVLSRNIGSLGAGGHRKLGWRAKPGVHTYQVEVSGRSESGTARVVVEAVVTVMRPLEILLNKDQVDLEERRLHFKMNNPAGRAELVIYGDDGGQLYEGTTELLGRQPGARLEVRWPRLSRPIKRMELRAYDASDSWSAFELLPFMIDIPHEDVVFESAKWEIRDSEKGKLDEAYDRTLEAIAEHGRDMKARLYILGHTDTVGQNGDNMLLSRRRAQAIANYFKARGGISLPILAQGFGESKPAVPTADNVDEPRNRRAQYILATQAPLSAKWITVSSGK